MIWIYSYIFVSKPSVPIADGTVVMVWQLDLQLPMQSVPITTKVVSSNTAHCEAYAE